MATVSVLHVFEREDDAVLVGGVCGMDLVSLHLVGPAGQQVADEVDAGFIVSIEITADTLEHHDG